jgi:S1-C subfamily serine protease
MEDLTKHQLILLVLLITFITSIGTSIISFSLLQQAPIEVTQTIDRVVEKTIERVVTEPGKSEKVVTTVVVSEEDRVVEAIAKNEKSIVRLKTPRADGSEFVSGIGVVVSEDGTIMTDSRSYNPSFAYSLVFFDEKEFKIGKVLIKEKDNLVFIKPAIDQSLPKYTFYPVKLGDSDQLKIGQTLVAISGRDSNSVSIGRIQQLVFDKNKKLVSIISDISFNRALYGSPILNLSGEIVGIEQVVDSSTYIYSPINTLKVIKDEALQEMSK